MRSGSITMCLRFSALKNNAQYLTTGGDVAFLSLTSFP